MQQICQCCAMPIEQDELKGIEKDKSRSREYCVYCYKDGEFTADVTMEEMVAICIPPALKEGVYKDEQEARKSMLEFFPMLKRWKK